MRIPNLICVVCGAEDIFAIQPGSDPPPEWEEMIAYMRDKAWCAKCWPYQQQEHKHGET